MDAANIQNQSNSGYESVSIPAGVTVDGIPSAGSVANTINNQPAQPTTTIDSNASVHEGGGILDFVSEVNWVEAITVTAVIFGSIMIADYCVRNMKMQKSFIAIHTNEITDLQKGLKDCKKAIRESNKNSNDTNYSGDGWGNSNGGNKVKQPAIDSFFNRRQN